MKSHIAVRLNGRYLALNPDTEIDIVDTNPYLNDSVELYSYQFDVPIDGNRESFSDIDTIESDKRLVSLEHQPLDVFVDNVCLRTGAVATADDQQIKDKVTLSMTARVRALSDYFGELNSCRELPMPEADKPSLQIGECIGNLAVTVSGDIKLETKTSGKTGFLSWSSTKKKQKLETEKGDIELELNPLGFSFPGICKEVGSKHESDGSVSDKDSDDDGKNPTVLTSFINVTDAYGEGSHGGQGAKFCNARVCYMHYKRNEDGTSSDAVDYSGSGTGADKTFNPYLVLEAYRPASGICFYVLYFLDVLFHYLKDYGISYDNSELIKVEDMKRLAFFTTRCKYDMERKDDKNRYADDAKTQLIERVFDFNDIEDINKWLSSRNCGGKLKVEWEKTKDIGGINYNGKFYSIGDKLPNGEKVRYADFKVSNVSSEVRANIMNMYANAQNFPDTSIQSVLDSLWASFGIRFYLNQETLNVKPFFIRDLFRNAEAPIHFPCEVITVVKESEKITGFRMTYSAESDARDQRANIRDAVRDYDTSYDYIDYRNIDTSKSYHEILNSATVSNMNMYVDLKTGNKYRIKVDGEATKVEDYHPLPFEVGQFKGVEIGDCSLENEDFIEEVTSDFQPIDWNDVNGRNERSAGTNEDIFTMKNDNTGQIESFSSVNLTTRDQVLAAFVDEDMWHENTWVEVRTAFGTQYADFYLRQSVKTRESYDPNNSDEGVSPLQEKDWGMSVALMRGGGSDATVQYYDYNYDMFGNAKYRQVSALYGMSSDSIDCWGRVYDYNGTAEGIGPEDRFSLKIRAYITDPQTGDVLCDDSVARRGLYDTFMAEYAHFLLNRKKVRLEIMCEVSALLNIQWNRRYRFGDYIGWINKIETHVSADKGVERVTVELYVL